MFGMAWCAAVYLYSKAYPPHRQPCKTPHVQHVAERRAVVAADIFGQAVFTEQCLENGFYAGYIAFLGHFYGQYVFAVIVADRQRLASFLFACPPPAFKVHRPKHVRFDRFYPDRFYLGAYRRASPFFREPFPFEYSLNWQNVVEENCTKALVPTAVFRSPNRP